jgi:hypothetical protein
MDIRELLAANLYDDSDLVDAVMDTSSEDELVLEPVQWGGSRPGRSANAKRDHTLGARSIYLV